MAESTDPDLAVIRDQYDAVNESDFDRAMSHYAEDVVLEIPSGIRSGTFEGREAVGRWFGEWFATFEHGASFEITEATALEDGSVLVVAIHRARGKVSGVEIEGHVHWRYWLRDGKIRRVRGFETREDALG